MKDLYTLNALYGQISGTNVPMTLVDAGIAVPVEVADVLVVDEDGEFRIESFGAKNVLPVDPGKYALIRIEEGE